MDRINKINKIQKANTESFVPGFYPMP